MAKSSLYLFKYNNYLNKILKRSETLQGYGTPLVTLRDTNFNPNDYISTTHIFNTWVMDQRVLPDYCVVCDASDNILSRWFVIDVKRTRGGQWNVSLLADLAADYKEELMSATCFIEKGYTTSSPFVFNNENMGFNQILSDLIPLENKLKTPWLVLYLARYKNASEGNDNIEFNSFSGKVIDTPPDETDYVLSSLSQYKYYDYSLGRPNGHKYFTAYDPGKVFFGALYRTQTSNPSPYYEMEQDKILGATGDGLNPFGSLGEIGKTNQRYPLIQNPRSLKGSPAHWTELNNIFNSGVSLDASGLPINSYGSDPSLSPGNIGPFSGYQSMMAENGKTLKVGNTVYRITVVQSTPYVGVGSYSIDKNSALGKKMREYFFDYNNILLDDNTIQEYYVHVNLSYPSLYLMITDIGETSQNGFSYDFEYEKSVTKDAAYEIIAAPYNSITFEHVPDQEGPFLHRGDIALQWFQSIINKYNGAKFAYDLQLVPYCPVDTLDLREQDVIYCTDDYNSNGKIACAIKLRTSSFSSIVQPESFPWNTDVKLSNELDLYRLVSPNGIGEYEWTPTKNGDEIGSIPFFEVDCTLIPFRPYIKVNPYFGQLYGADYNDYRGLICDGDFSLPIINNEWETYQLNNKYYQAIFDRTIQHQEFNNKYAKISDIVNAATGTLQGASQGGLSGGMVGGPIGAGIGTVIGGGLSAAGGVADVMINQKLRTENINYQKDQYGFELGTIKARSQSLTRTTSFNLNNKYFPYIEYYTCTPQEKQALQNKMKYNGMTIGVIGMIPDFLNPSDELTFVQGSIIEIDIGSDAAVADRLNQILQGGIRIKNG